MVGGEKRSKRIGGLRKERRGRTSVTEAKTNGSVGSNVTRVGYGLKLGDPRPEVLPDIL
jgi:hypothetical protein